MVGGVDGATRLEKHARLFCMLYEAGFRLLALPLPRLPIIHSWGVVVVVGVEADAHWSTPAFCRRLECFCECK